MTRRFSDLKIGLIARMDRSGLGYQTKALYNLLKPHRTIVIDSTSFNQREQHKSWYPDGVFHDGFIEDGEVRDLIDGCDVIISCEIFYCHQLPRIAREMGVKTILQPNAELNWHFVLQNIPKPDAFFLPSTWYDRDTRQLKVPTYLCPPPIDLEPTFRHVPKKVGELRVLHMAGRIAASDRNGTELVKAIRTLIPGVTIDIHNQAENDMHYISELYDRDYHLMLLPRRYGGLCLPMLESLGYGMPVLMPNISPNEMLPGHWRMAARHQGRIKTKRVIDIYATDKQSMIDRLIDFRNLDDEEYQQERIAARTIFDNYQSDLSKWQTYIEQVME